MKKILVVEDNEEVQKIYKEVLRAKFEVIQAWTAEEGLGYLKNQSPDLVILDIMLPKGMNGFDLLEIMKRDEKMKQIPVIVLTNLDSERKVAMEVGADDYLVKAYTTIEDVLEKVKKHIR